VVLAPLTASAGTNIKVLEAMAMGKVVVSTPAGVNGLDVTQGYDVLLAETGEQMTQRIADIVQDHGRREAIGLNARRTALKFDWRAIGIRQRDLYDRLRTGSPAR
jgi:glycosyltransferase involved in cell wall biosynthesis